MLPEGQLYVERPRAVRADILKTLNGLNADALNWHPLPNGTNSLNALAAHLLGAERYWLHKQIEQHKVERDRDAEFNACGENGAALRPIYERVERESDAILERLVESDMDILREGRTVRWCILHVIEHYNEHLGQVRLTRQLWENRPTQMRSE